MRKRPEGRLRGYGVKKESGQGRANQMLEIGADACRERGWKGMETWVKPDFEEVGVNAECSAYAAAR
jgi:hypothetical protein